MSRRLSTHHAPRWKGWTSIRLPHCWYMSRTFLSNSERRAEVSPLPERIFRARSTEPEEMETVGELKRKIKEGTQYLENVIGTPGTSLILLHANVPVEATPVPQTQYRNPELMNSSLTSLRGPGLKNIDEKAARTAVVTHPKAGLSPPGPIDLNFRCVVSTPAIYTCHSERKYHILWPATYGLDKHLNQRTYNKLVSICGGSSHVYVFDSRDLGVINWCVRLTKEEAEQVSSWPEILSPVGAPQECPARNEGSCKPSREQYIAWGTEKCWNDNDVAMRGARNLLDVVGHCSRLEATHYCKIAGNRLGVLYWRIIILDEQIDAVESIPEIREVELANWSIDPHYRVGRPIPNREKRAMKPFKPTWMPRDMDLVGGSMAGGSRCS